MKRLIVAELTKYGWTLATNHDQLPEAKTSFDRLCQTSQHEAVAIFTKGQWTNNRSRPRYLHRLQPDDRPIPSSLALWLINQADSSYF